MKKISSSVGSRNLDLSLGLIDINIGGYSQHHIDVRSGAVTTGMQKLADRFVVTLFNQAGSTKHDDQFGTYLIQGILVGSSMNFGVVQSNIAIAVERAKSQIIDDDNSPGYKDVLPDDERLEDAVCDSVEYDAKTGVLRMYVSLTNVVGEDYTYVLPVNLAFFG
jgi:hypothetical protein